MVFDTKCHELGEFVGLELLGSNPGRATTYTGHNLSGRGKPHKRSSVAGLEGPTFLLLGNSINCLETIYRELFGSQSFDW
jgi:hypothetical protein